MPAIANQLKQSGEVLQALDGVRNLKAFATLFAFLIAAVLTGWLSLQAGIQGGGLGFAALGQCLAILLVFVGVNGAGAHLMDESLGQPARSFADAAIAGVFATFKGIVVFLVLALTALIILLAVVLLFWVCKIPGIGPVLFTAAFPLSIIITGVIACAFLLVLFGVAAPALWRGHTVMQAFAQVFQVAQRRALHLIVSYVLLALLVWLAATIIGTILITGGAITSVLSLSIIGVNIDPDSLARLFSGFGGRYSPGPYLQAMLFGGTLVAGVAVLLPWLIQIKGSCLIYVQVIEGLDFSKAEAQIRGGMEQVKRRAEAAADRARQASQRQVVLATGPGLASAKCPSCGASMGPSDAFCESCGARARA